MRTYGTDQHRHINLNFAFDRKYILDKEKVDQEPLVQIDQSCQMSALQGGDEYY